MRQPRIIGHEALKREMMAVARGERAAPEDAHLPSFDSVAALMSVLTPQNRQLMAIIRDREPQSIAELAEWTGRAAPNLTRTLAKLEAAGLITIETTGRRKAPRARVTRLRVEIDPYSMEDRLEFA